MEPLLENNKIYVQGLSEASTDDALSEYFKKYGRVVKATVAMDRLTGKPKDFGFVWFEDEGSAKAAVGDVEDHVILGTKVEVKEAIRRERSSIQDIERENCHNCERIRNGLAPSKKIFVGGLPSNLTEDEFKSFFESYGQTTDVVIIVHKASRKPRGFGFVTYESEESVRAVLRTSRYVIHGKEVEVKVAIPKGSTNTTEQPNVHFQHHPSAGANGYYHSNFWPRYGVNGGLPYANSAPFHPYANGMVTTSPAYAYCTVAPSPAYANCTVAPSPAYSYSTAAPSPAYTNGMVTTSPAYAYGTAAPSPAYTNGMVTTSPAYAYGTAAPSPAYTNGMVNGFHAHNGYPRTVSNGYNVAPRPFTKIRISKPPGINGENSAAGLSSTACAEGPSTAYEDSNDDGRPSRSIIDDGNIQASSLANDS